MHLPILIYHEFSDSGSDKKKKILIDPHKNSHSYFPCKIHLIDARKFDSMRCAVICSTTNFGSGSYTKTGTVTIQPEDHWSIKGETEMLFQRKLSL